MKTINCPAFRDCAGYDFKALSNFVPPERTLSRPEFTWLNAPSEFYSHGECVLFQECCERRKPEEMEFARVRDESMAAKIHDALRTVLCMADMLPEWTAKALPLVEAHGATDFFRLSTVTTRRSSWDIAYVKNNTLFTL